MSYPTPPEHDCTQFSPAQHLEVAERALGDGDLGHAMLHVASALADDPHDPRYLAMLDRVLARADDPLSLVPFEPGTSYAIVAVRAAVLARRGQLGEALDLLFRIAQVRPEVPYLAWADGWLARPDAVASVEPGVLSDSVGRWVIMRRDADALSAMRVGIPTLERLASAHRGSIELRYWYAAAVRKTGEYARALDEARSLLRDHPSLRAAVAVAMVHREKGDLDAAVAAFQTALEHEPGDVSVRLDLGDMLCAAHRVDEGLRYYDEVLAREPNHPWALPSALFQRALRGDDAAAEALRLLTFNASDNRRANELAARLPDRTPIAAVRRAGRAAAGAKQPKKRAEKPRGATEIGKSRTKKPKTSTEKGKSGTEKAKVGPEKGKAAAKKGKAAAVKGRTAAKKGKVGAKKGKAGAAKPTKASARPKSGVTKAKKKGARR